MKAIEISKCLLSKVNIERFETIGDGISNLKLQKLLFYIQKTSISVLEKQMFVDNIQAWDYGPVVPTTYHRFKKYQNENIDVISESELLNKKVILSFDELLIIDFVWDTYSQYSAGKLVDITHQDKAWINNYIPRLNNIIEFDDMKDMQLKQRFEDYKISLETISRISI